VCNQGLGGFRGVNPGFTHFGGLGPVLGVGLFSLNTEQKLNVLYSLYIIIIDINIILSIYIYTGGGLYRGYMGYRGFIGV
jgi:hypothetical protein